MKALIKIFYALIFSSCLCSCKQNGEKTKGSQNIDSVVTRLNDPVKMARLDSLRRASLLAIKTGSINYLEYYEKALKIDTSDIVSRINHAYSILIVKNDFDGAVQEIRNTLKLYPHSPDALFALGTVLLGVKPDSALYYCEKAVQLYPNNYVLLHYLASYYNDQGLYQKAINCMDKVIAYQPKNQGLKLERGFYKLNMEDYKGAYNDMDTIPEAYSKYYNTYFNRAKTLYYLNRFKESIKDCDKAIEIDPNEESEIYLIRGLSKLGLEQIDAGYEDVKKAYEMGNKDAVDVYNKYQDYYKRHKKS
jgi:tetratricopeptide (TPR) repeat protein